MRVVPGNALREDGVMLDQPELVFGVGGACCGEGPHGGLRLAVVSQAQFDDSHETVSLFGTGRQPNAGRRTLADESCRQCLDPVQVGG